MLQDAGTGCILFLCSYEVVLFRYVHGAGNVACFFFDSHCTNSCRITDAEPGFSVLIKFDSLFQIERYIDEDYQLSGRLHPLYFQIQFTLGADDLAIIQSSHINYFRRMKR